MGKQLAREEQDRTAEEARKKKDQEAKEQEAKCSASAFLDVLETPMLRVSEASKEEAERARTIKEQQVCFFLLVMNLAYKGLGCIDVEINPCAHTHPGKYWYI